MGIKTECINKNKLELKQDMEMVFNPLYQGSTIVYKNYEAFKKYCRKSINLIEDVNPFPEYGRISNPTIFELSEKISKLEKGDFTIITNGGMSAVTTAILSYLKAGDHVLFSDGTYTSTKHFADKTLAKFGISHSYYDSFIENDLESQIQKNTKVIFFESCASGTFEVENMKQIAEIAKKHKIITICDNTMMTPILLNPIEHGIDVIVHSLTKFAIGHSDCMLGSITVKKDNFLPLYDYSTLIGNHANSQAVYMAIRGIKTLPLRVYDSVKRAQEIIPHILKHNAVKEVLHPSVFKDDVRHEKAKFINHEAVSLFTVVLKKKLTEDQLTKLMNSFKVLNIGLSWGGFESLCTPYSLASRKGEFIKEYDKFTSLRMYIGMEDSEDIIADIKSSLDIAS